MAKSKKDNRLKRKRGKKFVFHGDQKQAETLQQSAESKNPFEDHSKSKRAKKDAEARVTLVEEFRARGRTGEFVDKRIGENSSRLSEEDKMKLRFMREQKQQLQTHLKVNQTRKKTKFNLDNDSDDSRDFNFLTHKGKRIEDVDDFKDKIEDSDEDVDPADRDAKKGHMTEEMVNALNFGGGQIKNAEDAENRKKTREERHAEIMEKSKAYKFHAQEIKLAQQEYTRQLDDDIGELADLLDFNKTAKVELKDQKLDVFDDVMARLKTESGIQKLQAAKVELSEKEKAQARREKLLKLQEEQDQKAKEELGIDEDERKPSKHINKREAKLQSKRE